MSGDVGLKVVESEVVSADVGPGVESKVVSADVVAVEGTVELVEKVDEVMESSEEKCQKKKPQYYFRAILMVSAYKNENYMALPLRVMLRLSFSFTLINLSVSVIITFAFSVPACRLCVCVHRHMDLIYCFYLSMFCINKYLAIYGIASQNRHKLNLQKKINK